MALCWICNIEPGTTGEHLTKRSDIKSVLGAAGPLYRHDDNRMNVKLQSANAKKLKSTAPMCNTCNSARTQPHDYAWEAMSNALRHRKPALKTGDFVRANGIFRYDTVRALLNMHLFFVKWLGCQIVESSIPISQGIDVFAAAIMKQKMHPNVWLAFGVSKNIASVGSSNIDAATLQSAQGSYDYLCRFYHVGNLDVRVRFSDIRLKDDWRPGNSSRFVIGNLTGA